MLRQLDGFDAVDPPDPGVEIAMLEVVLPQPGAAGAHRLAHGVESRAHRRGRRVLADSQSHLNQISL